MGFLGGKRSNRKPTTVGKTLAKFFNEYDLEAVNMRPETGGPIDTFNSGVGRSTIDYIAIPKCLNKIILRCDVLKEDIMNTSDHYAVRAHLDLVCCEPVINKSQCLPRVKWGKTDPDVIREIYTQKLEEHATNTKHGLDISSINQAHLDRIIDDLVEMMAITSEKLPKSRYKANVRPYWNETLSHLKKTKVANFRAWVSKGRNREDGCPEWIAHKASKKAFRKELKFVQREYERKELDELLRTAEFDKNKFWQRVKNSRKSVKTSSFAIKNEEGKVVQDLSEVVNVWQTHFSKLSTEKHEFRFDRGHYNMVSRQVKQWYSESDGCQFLDVPLNRDEVVKAVNTLNKGKSAGFDSITAEHLQSLGESCLGLLVELFNRIIQLEHVPRNFKIGTQIPLYKGKNTCTLDPNNYRGITLLTSLNKTFEIILWQRLKKWWASERIISDLQGACKSGMSCVHSALTLQETVAVGLGTGKKVFVAYFDVAKAFDSVWIDGLFYQIHKMGVNGRIWRLLYQTYQDFWCKARVGGLYSQWYKMECGIHQGGFLSLLKYTAFIDPLIRELELSGLGCHVVGIPTNPVGYADDMATCCPSKYSLDSSLTLVSDYSNRWRYAYNAKKSAIMIYGENSTEHKRGRKYRNFQLCNEKVKETDSYDHVGIKNCLFSNYKPRTEERISKGRRAFNALTSVGIKRKGASMKVCSTLFWSVVAPIVTYGCEVWVLRSDEIDLLRKFQRMVGRRCQRFHPKSPNYSAYIPLGWLSLDRYIQGKKLLFLRTILVLDENAVCQRILKERSLEFSREIDKARVNEFDSPIYDLLNTSIDIGLYETCMNSIQRGHHYTKTQWKRLVWEAVWKREDEDCTRLYKEVSVPPLIFRIIDKPYYLLWWIVSDQIPKLMPMCEKMAAIATNSSLLKTDDVRLKNSSFWAKVCQRCDLGIKEDANHAIMQCPFYEDMRSDMYNEIENLQCVEINDALSNNNDRLALILGKHPKEVSLENMFKLCCITGKHVTRIYNSITTR